MLPRLGMCRAQPALAPALLLRLQLANLTQHIPGDLRYPFLPWLCRLNFAINHIFLNLQLKVVPPSGHAGFVFKLIMYLFQDHSQSFAS